MNHPTRTLALTTAAFALAACASGAAANSSTTTGATVSPTGAPTTTVPASTTATDAPTTTGPGSVDPNAPEVNPAGDIPDNQVFIPYQATTGDFTVNVPEGWSQTTARSTVVFTDKLNSIRVEESQTSAAPTIDSVTNTVVPQIAAASQNYESGKIEVVGRTAGDAILVTYRADSAPNDVTGKVIHLDVERYEFFSNGRLVTLTLSGPQGADNVDPWRIVTDSFAWLK
jgi:hypothetical protein